MSTAQSVASSVVTSVARSVAGGGGAAAPLVGKCYHFDGVNDYVDCRANLISTGDATYSVWFNVPATATTRVLFGSGNPSSVGGVGIVGYVASNNNVTVTINDGAGSGVQAVMACTPGTWQLLTITLTRTGNMIVYVNGVAGTPVSIAAKTGSLGSNSFLIGKYGTSASYGAGYLQDLRIYDSALSGSQVLELYTAKATALLGVPMLQHLKMMDQDATVSTDSSGNSRNGTKTNINAAIGQFHYEGDDVAFKWAV